LLHLTLKAAKGLSRFFVLSPRDARYALVTLASHTGWALSELLELNGHELMQWLDVSTLASPNSTFLIDACWFFNLLMDEPSWLS
jgi:hypothetical protein